MPKGPIASLRDSAARLRREGERAVARIDKDVRSLAKRTRVEIQTDVRKLQTTVRERADEAIRDVEKRGARVLAAVEKEAAKTVEEVLKRLQAATRSDITAVMKRVRELEARVTELEGVSDERKRASGS